jgi:hypothetical protein
MAMLTQIKRVEGFKRSVFLVGVYILRHKAGRQRDQRCKMQMKSRFATPTQL